MLLAFLLGILLSACAATPQNPTPVILVSVDGFRADYLDRGLTPVLARLAKEGVRATALVPVFPTKTFPNHYTIATGRWPGAHGIIGNEFFAPDVGRRFEMTDRDAVRDARFWGAEPIWVTAERQGVTTATLFWPGSEASIGGVRPTYMLPYDDDMPDSARVRQVLAWMDLPSGRRPAFLTLYTSVVDAAGHKFGPDAPQTRRAIMRADSTVGLLLAGLRSRHLEQQVNLIIVSDHGMAASSPRRVIHLDDYVDRAAVDVDALSPVLMLRPRAGLEDSVYRGLCRASHLSTYRRAELPARFHLAESRRVPALVAVADEGWAIRWRGESRTCRTRRPRLRRLARLHAGDLPRAWPRLPARRRGPRIPQHPHLRSPGRAAGDQAGGDGWRAGLGSCDAERRIHHQWHRPSPSVAVSSRSSR